MLRKYVILAVLAGSITFTQAAEPTPEMLGNLKASLQQTCGKGINIQIAELHGGDEGRTVLGLRNNQTGTRDLFISLNENNKQYDKYQPVRFDSLSKRFVAVNNERPSIIWGGAVSNLKGMEYSLALGSHVYPCSKLSQFESEVANDLYGEATNTQP
ncbi:MAG TPA: hypothetical protein VJY99_17145 [Buttiauxella sp.]|uniref:hypothetical protein n=1 Tax=Buttiauxella sp. TaxID=1972222 RepID=UPI002B480250|nr:hypothetical protein [Buttiauxella sp.]HKM98397.1 hypothetical protein [Buttiauxella sp.]